MQSRTAFCVRCTGARFSTPRTQFVRVAHTNAAHLRSKQDARWECVGGHQCVFRVACSQSKSSEVQETSDSKSVDDEFPGWDTVVGLRWSRTPWEGTIKSVNQGGALVSVHGIRGFIPYGELDPSRLPEERDAAKDFLVGQPIRAKIVQANLKTHQCVLSERDQVFQDNLEYFAVGATVRGTVKQVENYGAFVSLELADGKEHGIFGMVHKSEISWDTAQGPVDVVKVGDKVTPIITKLELDQCRISLSLKKAQEDPLEQNLDTLMPLDAGTVSDLQWEDSGAPFPELEGIVQELRNEPKVNSVEFGRSAEAPRAVSQDLEIWLSKEEVANGYTLVSRSGKSLQEVHVTTAMSRNDMKTLLSDVLRRTM